MILKGNQRGGGADLALHLMNAHDNERVEIAQIRGTVADDLYGAFGEFEAIAAGTRCKKPLYSLSINPSAPLTREQYNAAIDRIEEGLGLSGQARAVVFHVKNGREHCHVVWSRVDAVSMRAVHIAHDRMKLRTLSRELAREFGQALPEGIAKDRGAFRDNAADITLADKAQAERSGLSPTDRKAGVTDAFRRSDSAEAFKAALAEKGFILASGDRRDYVIVDADGGVHSLARQIDGVRTREVRKLLASLPDEQLPSVEQARALAAERQKAVNEAVRVRVNERMKDASRGLAEKQAKRREPLDLKRQETEIKHRSERMALHAAQKSEMERPFARAASAVFTLIARNPALRSVLKPLYRNPHLNPLERHLRQRSALERRHMRERAMIARDAEVLKKLDAKEQRSLQVKLRRTIRVEESARHERVQQRYDQFATNVQDVAATKKGQNGKDAWRERKEDLARKHAQRRKPAPGYRLNRDEPS